MINFLDKGYCAANNSANGILARLEGFEPPAYGLEVRCSIQLSYRRARNGGKANTTVNRGMSTKFKALRTW
jgi:hypothetical protein